MRLTTPLPMALTEMVAPVVWVKVETHRAKAVAAQPRQVVPAQSAPWGAVLQTVAPRMAVPQMALTIQVWVARAVAPRLRTVRPAPGAWVVPAEWVVGPAPRRVEPVARVPQVAVPREALAGQAAARLQVLAAQAAALLRVLVAQVVALLQAGVGQAAAEQEDLAGQAAARQAAQAAAQAD